MIKDNSFLELQNIEREIYTCAYNDFLFINGGFKKELELIEEFYNYRGKESLSMFLTKDNFEIINFAHQFIKYFYYKNAKDSFYHKYLNENYLSNKSLELINDYSKLGFDNFIDSMVELTHNVTHQYIYRKSITLYSLKRNDGTRAQFVVESSSYKDGKLLILDNALPLSVVHFLNCFLLLDEHDLIKYCNSDKLIFEDTHSLIERFHLQKEYWNLRITFNFINLKEMFSCEDKFCFGNSKIYELIKNPELNKMKINQKFVSIKKEVIEKETFAFKEIWDIEFNVDKKPLGARDKICKILKVLVRG